MERVILEEVAPNDRIMSGMKHLLVKYSLCRLIWKAEKVSEVVVIVTPKHFRTCLHCSQNPRQKRMDGDSAKASCNALSFCCRNWESSSILFGDYFDDGSNQCNGATLCSASGEFGFVWRAPMTYAWQSFGLSKVTIKHCLVDSFAEFAFNKPLKFLFLKNWLWLETWK